MNNKKVSIIVPAYNASRTIIRCLESIKSQIYSNYEAIIIDDGSTDDTYDKCLNFCHNDSRFRCFRQLNKGVSSARNYGNKVSQGYYICYVDSDDYIDDMYLENMASKYNNTDLDLVVSGFFYEDKLGVKLSSKKKSYFLEEKLALNDTFNTRGISGISCNKLFKKNIIVNNNLNFNARLRKYEDHLFCIEYILHCKKILYTGCNTYHYCFSNNSSYKSKDNLSFKNDILAYDLAKGKLRQHNVYSKKLFSLISIAKVDIAIDNILRSKDDLNVEYAIKYLNQNLKISNIFKNGSIKFILKRICLFFYIKFNGKK